MFCSNCGTQNPDNARFCANCGAGLVMPDINTVPQAAPQPAPVIQPSVSIPLKKTNVMCVVGFIGSMASILLMGLPAIVFLILSIIGIVSANKKGENGRGFAIAGICISLVFVVVWIVATIFGIKNSIE